MLVTAHAMRVAALGVVASVVTSACDASVDTSLEHKACGLHGECLPGWVCSDDEVCVKKGSRDDPQAALPDASLQADAAPAAPPVMIGRPGCDVGLQLCGASCADVNQDADHCGACDHACAGNDFGRAVCNAGVCELVCNDGYTRCGNGCYRLNDDPQHCGSCTLSCPTAQTEQTSCLAGTCRASCNPGFTDCSGACVRAATDPANCGACGVVCPADQQCAAGACVTACPGGTLACAKSCTDPKTDPLNCGACGNTCPATPNAAPACKDGVCATQCNPGLSACGTACVDLQVDLRNCGACAKACPAPASRSQLVCAAGSCMNKCDPGYVACEDQCVSPALAERSAQVSCAELATTQDRFMCQGQLQNTTYCAGMCVNILTNKQHCGRCDRACDANQRCYAGTCLGS